ncbi:hypothetical protein RHA1_ro05429 [Rhodococcus jostii RHA1]|uniref:Uncharacterized protein n=1 Tax=Rhodococcus jostii (strain RHA1) TaxID=101510 RepID=Q0S5H7_RHOJR|nr:hypothetical protein RHA1_ro05429 [Rhodococcus jostii RHA1]
MSRNPLGAAAPRLLRARGDEWTMPSSDAAGKYLLRRVRLVCIFQQPGPARPDWVQVQQSMRRISDLRSARPRMSGTSRRLATFPLHSPSRLRIRPRGQHGSMVHSPRRHHLP